MAAYSDKLKDPRWQRKRLEIMSRDNFRCSACGDAKSTLHIHHKRYISGREPWEYADDLLVTLCETCHENINVMPPAAEFNPHGYRFKLPEGWLCACGCGSIISDSEFRATGNISTLADEIRTLAAGVL